MYRFCKSGKVDAEDLNKVIELTRFGLIKWISSQTHTAFNAEPTVGSARIEGHENIRSVRIGYHPETLNWTYVRLTDENGSQSYVEEGSSPQEMEVAGQVYQIAKKATRLGGRLTLGANAVTEVCPNCDKTTEFVTLYDAAHGIPGALMADSERAVCMECEHSISIKEWRTKKVA